MLIIRRLVSLLVALPVLLSLPVAGNAETERGSADLVRARSMVFGAESVNQKSGRVDRDKVIFSWLTNATLAVSIKGRVVMLDTFVDRAEIVPGRTPFVVEDLVSLNPEAVFIGEGLGHHADNAAWLAGKLGIPLFASEETCSELRADALHYVYSGVLTNPNIDCRNVTSAGSHPGVEIVTIDYLEPYVSITAFRHFDGGASYPESGDPDPFPIIPVKNIGDPRDPDMYPWGIPHSFKTNGTIGGPISIYYHFVVHGDKEFTFVWHDTIGDLHHGCSIDHQPPTCWDDLFPNEQVTNNVKLRIAALSATDVEFGSFVNDDYVVNGMRDSIEYSALLKPKVYVPIHQTSIALPTSSLYWKVAYLRQLDQMIPTLTPEQRPEPRWMVDPEEYLKPMVFDPKDHRWAKRDNDFRR